MTSGPGITGKTDSPDDAIEEISGLLEMDELKASDVAQGGSGVHAVSDEVGDALDVAMETPSPAKLDSYLPPPPVSDEPAKEESADSEAGLGSNMAYEDLLEKLVLPAQPAPVEEPAAHQVTPRPSTTHVSSPPDSLFPANITPGPITSDERTVVTVNPLLAEEQEAAARGADSYILPAAPPPQPLLPDTPVVVPVARPAAPTPKFAVLPGKLIQTTYPILGGIVLGGIILGVLIGRASAPTKVIEKVSVVQAQPAAAPAAPVQAAQAANPSPPPAVVPIPTEAQKPAAQPAAAEPAQPAAAAAPAEAEEAQAEEAKPEAKPKAHHAKASRPAKPAAKPAAAAKPVAAAKPAPAAAKPAPAAKPAGGKKPGKGWVDPFAN